MNIYGSESDIKTSSRLAISEAAASKSTWESNAIVGATLETSISSCFDLVTTRLYSRCMQHATLLFKAKEDPDHLKILSLHHIKVVLQHPWH